jgi:hypothetical protein
MSKRLVFFSLVVASLVLLSGAAARADSVRVTGSFTSFTGVVLGDSGPSYIDFCPGSSCGAPVPVPHHQVCPDTGCSTGLGIATNVPIHGDPTSDANPHLFFLVDSQTENELIFQAARDPNSFLLNDVNPNSRFRLGTITFTNGLWTGDANFGFSIVAQDVTTHTTNRFDGFIRMVITPNTGTPQQNADFIYITDPAGNPVLNPLTFQTLPSIRAYELGDGPAGSNSVTVDLFGRFGSLDLTDFDNATGGGFIDVSLTLEPGGPPSSVPESGTFALLGCGVLAIAALKKLSMY